jgi:hypothetical protein
MEKKREKKVTHRKRTLGFHLTEKKQEKTKKETEKDTRTETSSSTEEKQTVPCGEKRKWDFCGADGKTEPLKDY